MTQYEQRILLGALHNAIECYMKQKQRLKAYMDTKPKFPMISAEYRECKGALLALLDICRELKIGNTDVLIQMLEDEE